MTTRAYFGWMWRDYLRRHTWLIVAALILLAIEGSMVGLLSYMVRPMFDQVFIAGDRSAVGWVAGLVAGLFILRAVAGFGGRAIMGTFTQRVLAALQGSMLAHMLTLDSSYFQKNAPGTLIERVRGDTTAAASVWEVLFSAAGRDVVSLISLLAVAISIDWLWTLIAIVGAPILVVPIMVLQRYVRATAHRARVAAAGLSTRLDETFHGINTIKLNTIEDKTSDRFGRSMRDFVRAQTRTIKGQAGIPAMMDIVAAVGFFGVLAYGGMQIIGGEKTVGEFMSFFTAMALVFEPLRRLGNVSGTWQAAAASLARIREVFDTRPTIVSPAAPVAGPADPTRADIVFEDVHFSYGDQPVLNGVSFTARAGETLALVGPSGAGKSTIFNLVTRLVDRDGGRITLGGTAIEEMDLDALRRNFSVVAQDSPLFDETLRDNITLEKPGIDPGALDRAVEAAHLTDFVAGLPQGLDTPAGPRGSNLSGGQRQRVAIARALLKDAPILLLDEATSALDTASEAAVQAALERLSADRTTLVIAHRLSTVRDADRIIVMEAGRVVDTGTHDELLSRGGLYAQLHRIQFAETTAPTA